MPGRIRSGLEVGKNQNSEKENRKIIDNHKKYSKNYNKNYNYRKKGIR